MVTTLKIQEVLYLMPPQIGLETPLNMQFISNITPEKKLEFQQMIQDDPLLCLLAETIVAGWPEDVNDVSNALRPYHNYYHKMC